MIGTALVEELVQTVAVSHLVKGHRRVGLLLLAAPESGKTTIVKAATAAHVCPIAIMSGRSVLKELKEHTQTEFLLFNDLTAIRAMSRPAVNLLILLLNQLTQDEHGAVAFAGKDVEHITRPVGLIACLPFTTFTDHRARWREMGFVSRMVPFAYHYPDELVARIKDAIDDGRPTGDPHHLPRRTPRTIRIPPALTRIVRHLADARANALGQLGIRLLQHYHTLVRAHALLGNHTTVTVTDLVFLRAIDRYVSIDHCEPLS